MWILTCIYSVVFIKYQFHYSLKWITATLIKCTDMPEWRMWKTKVDSVWEQTDCIFLLKRGNTPTITSLTVQVTFTTLIDWYWRTCLFNKIDFMKEKNMDYLASFLLVKIFLVFHHICSPKNTDYFPHRREIFRFYLYTLINIYSILTSKNHYKCWFHSYFKINNLNHILQNEAVRCLFWILNSTLHPHSKSVSYSNLQSSLHSNLYSNSQICLHFSYCGAYFLCLFSLFERVSWDFFFSILSMKQSTDSQSGT